MDDRAIKAQARAADNAGSGSAPPEARDGPGRRVAAQARRALSEAIREDRAEAIRKGRGKLAPHPRAEVSRVSFAAAVRGPAGAATSLWINCG